MNIRRLFFRIVSTRPASAVTVLLLFTSTVGTVLANDTLRAGMLQGLNGHDTTGTVSLLNDGDAWKVVLGNDFSFDGAPDPKIALGNNGKHDPATLLEVLKSNTGAQDYTFPASVDGSKYNEVYLWCEAFSVGLGIADLN